MSSTEESIIDTEYVEKPRGFFSRWIVPLLIAIILATGLHFFVVQPFVVKGNSMVPTFHENEYLVIDRISYYVSKPSRGDVIVFRYPLDPSFYFIKRVVALPGDTVHVGEKEVTVTLPDGTRTRSIADPMSATLQAQIVGNATTTLGEDEYFVLGDNGIASDDSRAWGPLQRKFIIGRVIARLWPLSEVGIYPGLLRNEN